MKNRRARGFTLIEILLVVGLVGIIASAALAPLVVTVRSLEEAQARWGRRHNARDAADAMYRDLRLALRNPSFQSVRIIHEESLGNDADDRLVMWSAAPKYEGKSAGAAIMAPTLRRTPSIPLPPSRSPSSVYSPPLWRISPQTMRISVVFPAPLRPTKP